MKKALLQMNLAVFLWGFTGVLGRAISIEATSLVWWRLLITVISLWVIFAFQGKTKTIRFAGILPIAGIGVILSLHWVCFYASIKLANVTIALTCLSTTALMASLLEPLILRKKFDRVEILLGLFALAGIVLIYQSHLQFSIGIVVGLLSALLTVLVSVLNKKIIDRYDSSQITLFQLTGGFAGLTLLLPVFGAISGESLALPTVSDWVWLVLLSWVCTIFTFFLYIRALKLLSAFTANLALTLEPVYGIILAFIIYQENRLLSSTFYIGFALISLAVFIHTWRLIRK